MAAVIAAILAAFLAGAVALFREHRLQQRRLLVAARVTYDTFGVAANGIRSSLNTNKWALFNALPGETSFSTTWETYKGDLAGHLTWEEWGPIEKAVSHYLAIRTMSQDNSPEHARSVLDRTQAALEEGREFLYPYCERRLSVWRLIQRWLAARRRRKSP
jgi:hypothetical protein